MMNLNNKNIDYETCESFGEEWKKFDQANLNYLEAKRYLEYFDLFPWDQLPQNAEGLDIDVVREVGSICCSKSF